MTEQQDSLSASLDEMFRRRRGIEPQQQQSPEEAEAQRRKNEDAALASLENRAERQAAARRLGFARRALLSTVATLRHGRIYDAEDRADLVDEVMRRLGTQSDKVRGLVRPLIDKAADAIKSGDKMTGIRGVDDVAEAIANAPGRIGKPETSPNDDGIDDTDPAALAARIPRF
jgi:hypothetical protein